jgi:hypothetical protein
MTSATASSPATIHSAGFPSAGVDHAPSAAPMAKARQTAPNRPASRRWLVSAVNRPAKAAEPNKRRLPVTTTEL